MMNGDDTCAAQVRDYLRSLKWDGRSHIKDFAGQPAFKDPEVAEAAFAQFFDDAVRRAVTPGCAVEKTIVVVGPEATGKSRLFEVLGGRWYGLSARDHAPRDAAWIVERPFDDGEDAKAFLAAMEDAYRPPYGRTVTQNPRVFVCAMTSNVRDLSRRTSSRRFNVVEVVSRIELDAGMRDSLWAEAYARQLS